MTRNRNIIEKRTAGQLKAAYEIEKELAARLRKANAKDRQRLYNTVYDEWYQRVYNNASLSPKRDLDCGQHLSMQIKFLSRFLKPSLTFLEVGPGDGSLTVELTKYVRHVYAVDVSSQLLRIRDFPGNFSLLISDGRSIPLPSDSVSIVYSNQLMEHLHPEDACDQLCNIFKVLTPGGMYVCITPNRLSGPHDISGGFDRVAAGFHLKEYTVTELVSIFQKVGFSRIRLLIGFKGYYMLFPVSLIRLLEKILSAMPYVLCRKMSSLKPISALLGIRIIAVK